MSNRLGAPRQTSSSPQNLFDERRCQQMTDQFRQILSTKRMNELNHKSSLSRTASQSARDRHGTFSPHPQQHFTGNGNDLPTYGALRNIPLVPEPPKDARSVRFRNMLHTLSQMPCKWENPGLLDEALRVVPLERIYNDAEEESQVLRAEAESLGAGKKAAWGYQDCVIRALMRWFKSSFFSWVNNPPCSVCGHPSIGVGMAAPTPDEQARGASQVELYQCSYEACHNYERFPRYNDAFVLLETRRGRVGEWANCFGMLCRAMGARVRWIWNSEDHVWLEVYSLYRRKWVSVDVCEQAWGKPKLYTEGWQRKLAYCVGFSADGAMDVTRRYVRNFSQWGAERSRTPEPVLLYILDEIRATKRKNMSKQDKFKLEGEEMREYRELQGYVTFAIVEEVCKTIPERFLAGQSGMHRSPRSDPDAQKAAEARQNSVQVEAERQRIRGPNGAFGAPNPHHQNQPPPPR